jgi:hypothetical protein
MNEDLTALALLQRTYRDPLEEPSIRRKCAIAALPYESPRYEAIAIADLRGGSGERLAQARERVAELDARAFAEGLTGVVKGDVVLLHPPGQRRRRF